MAVRFAVTKDHRTGYTFERVREGATTKEVMYIRKKTLVELGIDPAKDITIVQYTEDGEQHDPS